MNMTAELRRPELGWEKEWNILGNGPSLRQLTPQHLGPGPSIAVNAAVYHGAISPNFWAALDPPKKMAEDIRTLMPERMWPPMILTFERSAADWREMCPTHHVVSCAETRPELERGLPFETETAWGLYTTMFAIAVACIHGAKEVRLYGCDMVGWRGAYGFDKESSRSDDRWRREFIQLERAQREAKLGGVTIRRVMQ